MNGFYPFGVGEFDATSFEGWGYDEQDALVAEVESLVYDLIERHMPLPPPRPIYPGSYVGWSQPPRPVDVIASFNPRASKRDQARAVLYDFYHDDPLRYWSDNQAVKKCFIGGKDPRKEDHDPLLLIAAYENPNHKIWQCTGKKDQDQNKDTGTGMHWADMNKAVQQAIAHRMKLGPLPKSSYDSDPLVLYFYDNDKMKRVTYPLRLVPESLDQSNTRWWTTNHVDPSAKFTGGDDIHILETDNPRKIQIERENPGYQTPAKMSAILAKYSKDFAPFGPVNVTGQDPIVCPQCTGKLSMRPLQGSAGGWDKEGFTYDQDVVGTGLIGAIVGAVMAVVTAVATVFSFGALAVPLGVLTPFVVAAVNAADTALHAGDFGAATASLGSALIHASIQAGASAAGAAGFNIPPAAVKALGSTVTAISNDIQKGQQKKLEFGELWGEVAKKAASYGKLGDDQALAIATMLGGTGVAGNESGHVFVQGYLAGKFLDQTALTAIAKLLQGYATFADPRIINIALLGMGIGHLAGTQAGTTTAVRGSHATMGPSSPKAELEEFVVGVLLPRYGISGIPSSHVGYGNERDPLVANTQRALNRFYGLHLPINGILDIATSSALRGFQRAFQIGAGDGIPTADTLTFLEAAIAQHWTTPPMPPIVSGEEAIVSGEEAIVSGEEGLPPQPDYGPLSRGCPQGYWWDPINQVCRPIVPIR